MRRLALVVVAFALAGCGGDGGSEPVSTELRKSAASSPSEL